MSPTNFQNSIFFCQSHGTTGSLAGSERGDPLFWTHWHGRCFPARWFRTPLRETKFLCVKNSSPTLNGSFFACEGWCGRGFGRPGETAAALEKACCPDRTLGPLLTLWWRVRRRPGERVPWRRGRRGAGDTWTRVSMHYEAWRRRIVSLGNENMVKRRITFGSKNLTRRIYHLWHEIFKKLYVKKSYILCTLMFSEQHILCDLKIRQVQSNNSDEWQEMLIAS